MIAISSPLLLRFRCRFHSDLAMPNISLWNAILQGASSGIGTKIARMLTVRARSFGLPSKI
ncbi:hypothetical protein KFK09_018407 [Dendrobium nobile]|uniref:Uncharacterized protein n=1 Tax=Dendrobium nobile TaxID=94219 RepID=A0A8T3AVZ7_DENNO|nr:hypothetical protein KFK09_018407 [Dendrobium nobile]